jgi:hypothetical protein
LFIKHSSNNTRHFFSWMKQNYVFQDFHSWVGETSIKLMWSILSWRYDIGNSVTCEIGRSYFFSIKSVCIGIQLRVKYIIWITLKLSNDDQTGKKGSVFPFNFFRHFPFQWSKTAKKINTKRHQVWALLLSMFTRSMEWNYENPDFSSRIFVTKKCLSSIFSLLVTTQNLERLWLCSSLLKGIFHKCFRL